MFLDKMDEVKEAKLNILKRPILEFLDDDDDQAEFHINNAASPDDPIMEEAAAVHEEEAETDDIIREEEEEEEEEEGKCFLDEELSKPTLGDIMVTNYHDDDDDNDKDEDDIDGFRTPTSLDHKIPVMTQCPPAPRKPKVLPLTTMSSSSRKRKILVRVLDFSKEVESLFHPPDLFSSSTTSRKIKKARRDHDITK